MTPRLTVIENLILRTALDVYIDDRKQRAAATRDSAEAGYHWRHLTEALFVRAKLENRALDPVTMVRDAVTVE
jgi:hypothetical protein